MKTKVLRISIVRATKQVVNTHPVYLCNDEEYGFHRQYDDEKEFVTTENIKLNNNSCEDEEIDMGDEEKERLQMQKSY